MSFGGGGTNTIKSDIPLWVQQKGAENYNQTEAISQRPYQQSPNTVADFNATNFDVFNRVNGLQGMSAAGFGQARDITSQVAGYQPQQVQSLFGTQNVNSGNVAGKGAAIQAAMNPYLDTVEANALRAVDHERMASLNSNADAAFQAGGFGGSRAALQNAVTNSLAVQKAGDLSAQIRAQGYDNATGLLTSDAARNLAAQQSNQNAYMNAQQLSSQAQQFNSTQGMNAAQLRLGAAQQLGLLTGQQLDGTGKEIGLLDTVAGQQRAQQQALLDQQAQWWNDSYNYPIAMQNLRSSALGLTPYSTSQTSSQNGSGSVLGSTAGGALMGSSIAGALGASSGWGALAGAALGAAGGR